MAILSKDQYQKRNENAAKRMIDNKTLCSTLSDEQHDILAWLCTVRHNMHCNQDTVYYTESADHNAFNDLLNGWHEQSIKQKLLNVEIDNELEWDIESLDTDFCVAEGIAEQDHDHSYEAAIKFMATVNNDIERFLKNIDKEHGTNYCPTGAQRF